jgi:hypothetical protein
MKYRRPDAHDRRAGHQHREGMRRGQHQQPGERERHPHTQRIRPGPPVGQQSDQRLKKRRRELIRQRDQPDLREIQMEPRLEQRVGRRQHRRKHIVHEVAQTDRRQHLERSLLASRRKSLYLGRHSLIPAKRIRH